MRWWYCHHQHSLVKSFGKSGIDCPTFVWTRAILKSKCSLVGVSKAIFIPNGPAHIESLFLCQNGVHLFLTEVFYWNRHAHSKASRKQFHFSCVPGNLRALHVFLVFV